MENNDISDFYEQEKTRKLKDFNVAVYNAKNALFISAGLLLIPMVIAYSRNRQLPATLDMLIFVAMFCGFIGLALWSSQKPYTALVAGGLAYLVYILIYTIPYIKHFGAAGLLKGLYTGFLFKIIILSLLGKAAPKAKQMQTIKEEL